MISQSPTMDVILGRCDDMRSEVYVRFRDLHESKEVPVISGTLTGPESSLAITLPTTATLSDLGPGPDDTLLARAVLTEPGYWTPELPHQYHLRVDVNVSNTVVASCNRHVGLRRLGIRSRSFWLEGRRWVPRGVHCRPDEIDPDVFRTSLTSAVIDKPPEDVCMMANEQGIPILARFDRESIIQHISLFSHVSVMAVILHDMRHDQCKHIIELIRPLKGTSLLGLEVDGGQPPPTIPEGLDFLVVSLQRDETPHDGWHQPHALPCIGFRPKKDNAQNQRKHCDALQTDLSRWLQTSSEPWDWAGFIC